MRFSTFETRRMHSSIFDVCRRQRKNSIPERSTHLFLFDDVSRQTLRNNVLNALA